jgi:hypothetical protein
MLAREERAARGSGAAAKEAALLTHPARCEGLKVSGRRASRQNRHLCGASNKGQR